MTAQNVCKWNKFGYCKHKECCRNKHIKELCEYGACDIVNCIFRHPHTTETMASVNLIPVCIYMITNMMIRLKMT